MAEGILILTTPPARNFSADTKVKPWSYEVLFLYKLDPVITDATKLVVAPTPVAELLQVVSQKTIDRYLKEDEVAGFESGTMAWEHIVGSVLRMKDKAEDDCRLETAPELIGRLTAEWARNKAYSIARWTETYAYSGRRLSPSR